MPFTTSTVAAPETLLTLNQIAERAGVSRHLVAAVVKRGRITPDAFTGKMPLFKASRWEEFRRILRDELYYSPNGLYVRVQFDAPGHPLNPVTDFH